MLNTMSPGLRRRLEAVVDSREPIRVALTPGELLEARQICGPAEWFRLEGRALRVNWRGQVMAVEGSVDVLTVRRAEHRQIKDRRAELFFSF